MASRSHAPAAQPVILVRCPDCHWVYEYPDAATIQCRHCRRRHVVEELRLMRPEVFGVLVEEPGAFRRMGTRTLSAEYYPREDGRRLGKGR